MGEVIKPMDKKRVLVKGHPDGRHVVDLDKSLEMSQITSNLRGSYSYLFFFFNFNLIFNFIFNFNFLIF